MSVSPFLRPDLDQASGVLPLYITGALPRARPGIAYEGRLQIHNAVGACTVEKIAGDALPNGTQLYVDNATQEIVIAWPAYAENPWPLVNSSFNTGDVSGWTVTKRGELPGYPVAATADGGRPFEGGYSALWKGNEGTGHARGVEATWVNSARADVYPGQRVNVSAQIALDDTDTSQNRGQALVIFYDEGGDESARFEGELIRGNDRSYRLSTAQGRAQVKGTVAAAVWTTANESPGSGVRFDAVAWDAPTLVGINIDATLNLTLRVRDTSGRTATWSGSVVVVAALWDFNWEPSGVSFPAMHGLFDVLWSGLFNRFIACGYYNASPNTSIISSDDAFTWTQRRGASGDYFTAVVEAPGIGSGTVFVYGASQSVAYTTNGTNFTKTTTNVNPGGNGFYSVAWSPSLQRLVGVGLNGAYISANGISDWVQTSTSSGSLGSDRVIWVAELALFVWVNGATLRTSPDGTTWTNRWTTDSPYNVFWMADEQLLYAFISPSPVVFSPYMTSPDGINWTRFVGPVPNDFGFIANMNPAYSPELKGALIGRGSGTGLTALMDGVASIHYSPGLGGSQLLTASAWSSSLGRFVAVGSAGGTNMVMVSTPGF